MTSRNDRLQQFFGAYFHQDWDVEGATCWEDVVDSYMASVPGALVDELRRDLSDWLVEARSCSSPNLDLTFGCDFEPETVGLTGREWVAKIVQRLER